MIELFDMSYWNNYDINEEPLLKYLNYISDILKLGNRKLEYYEKHHIIPKSVDNTYSKDKNNLIELSGREHFEAHKLLLDCFNDINKAHMYYSYNLMCNSLHNNNYNITPEDYEQSRIEFKKICVENNTGNKNPNYDKKHPGLNLGQLNHNYGKKYSQEFKNYLSEIKKGDKNPRFGKKHKIETKKLIGANSKGRIWINNGINNKFIKSDDMEYYIQLGFIYKGCLITGKNR
jgi:hypothetical protein